MREIEDYRLSPSIEAMLSMVEGRAAWLDAGGTIRAVNRAWGDDVRRSDDGAPALSPGQNYIEGWSHAAQDPAARQVWLGLQGALACKGQIFSGEYRDEQGRWRLVGLPLKAEPGLMVVQTKVPDPTPEPTFRFFSDLRCCSAAECASVGYALLDREGRLIEANPEFLALLGGASEEKSAGRALDEWIPVGDRERVDNAIRLCGETRRPERVATQLRQNCGARRPVVLHLISFGNLPHLGCFAVDLSRQARAALALRQSEDRYRTIVETQLEMICRYLPDTTLTFVNEAYCRFFKRTREELVGTKFIELVPINAQPAIREQLGRILASPHPLVFEHEVLSPGGERCFQQWVDVQIRDECGTVVEIQAIGHDVTAYRRVEGELRTSREQIRDLLARLMNAQEEERRRIARELHDDLSQRLAAYSINLTNIKRENAKNTALADQLEQLERQAMELGDAIRLLSHQLHPSVLDHLGLPAALRSFCNEFSYCSGLIFDLDIPDCPNAVTSECSLMFYRVAQEIIRNVARHAEATRVKVSLHRRDDHVRLFIEDNGVGFEIEKIRPLCTLGLISIEERVRFLNGRLVLDTAPGRGTRVTVEIPLHSYGKIDSYPSRR
jgi:PAS domain S-box-containing protein